MSAQVLRRPGPGPGGMALAALTLTSCLASDPTGPALLQRVPLQGPAGAALVAGGGTTGLIGYHDAGVLHVVQLDAPSSDLLVELASVETAVPTALGVSETRVALASGLSVWVVDPRASPVAVDQVQLTATTPRTCWVPGVVASGRWLLASSGGRLELVDVEGSATRVLFDVSQGCVTQLLATPGGFLAFTTEGWIDVQPGLVGAGQPFAEVDQQIFGIVRAAFADGQDAILAGEVDGGRTSWVGRFSLAGSAPQLVNEIKLPVPYGGFAWDGQGMAVLQAVEVAANGSRHFTDGYVVREASFGFRASPVPLPVWEGLGCTLAQNGLPVCDEVPSEHLAALDGHLLANEGPPYARGWYRIR